jgi:hypothetical protein
MTLKWFLKGDAVCVLSTVVCVCVSGDGSVCGCDHCVCMFSHSITHSQMSDPPTQSSPKHSTYKHAVASVIVLYVVVTYVAVWATDYAQGTMSCHGVSCALHAILLIYIHMCV